MLFCFVKQKTAYEMRISDWSSDVCSSDLQGGAPRNSDWRGHYRGLSHRERGDVPKQPPPGRTMRHCLWPYFPLFPTRRHSGRPHAAVWPGYHQGTRRPPPHGLRNTQDSVDAVPRSEEHTSELQSLMRISYAVFCLKKKKQTRPN